jgi:mannose/fructose/N-acetylgalactosamine-specific phosphotransferase system component IIB
LPKKLHKKGIIVWHKFVKVSSSLVLIICWNDIIEKNKLKQKLATMAFNQFIEIKISKPHNTHIIWTHKEKQNTIVMTTSLLL